MEEKKDFVILGGGPGGYVAAIRGAQLGKKVVLVEKDRLGGVCINWGCILTKYLLHQTKVFKEITGNENIEGLQGVQKLNWKRVQKEKNKIVDRLVQGIEFLLKKNRVEVIYGDGQVVDKNRIVVQTAEGEKVIQAEKMMLATGSKPADLPSLVPNGKDIITSREALVLKDIPKKILIVGAGAIGLELGTIFLRLGVDVTIFEIMPAILPGSDNGMSKRLERLLRKQGLQIHTEMKIEKKSVNKGKVILKGICLRDQTPFEFSADKVLLATGRRPNFECLRRLEPSLSFNKEKFVKVNKYLETSIRGVYAIGDLIGGKLLAHKASHEGIIAIENASGFKNKMNYDALPFAVYTDPEFASVGVTKEEAQKKGIKTQVGLFSLQSNGRALTLGKPEGMVKIIADNKDTIIGAHIIAPNASEFIAELTLAVKKEMSLRDVSSSIHIHPTLSEATMEAALKAKNEAIHGIN
ncbi:dihydrolipoyl dehydrogenase [Acidobacteriota bacterium]